VNICVIGLDWDLGVPLAYALLGYTNCGVFGLGEPNDRFFRGLPPPGADRELHEIMSGQELALTDSIDTVYRHADLVLVSSRPHSWAPVWALGTIQEQRPKPLPVVVVREWLGNATADSARLLQPNIDLGFCPLEAGLPGAIERFTNPAKIDIAGSEELYAVFEPVWRAITNTVPITRYHLSAARKWDERRFDIPDGPTGATGRH
jgi:hypothetical protein